MAAGAGEPKPFSMVGIEVDRTTLTPTIKPRAQELDPAEVRRPLAQHIEAFGVGVRGERDLKAVQSRKT